MNKVLQKLTVLTFGLAVVRRLFHTGLGDILPLRGEPHEHGEARR